MKIRIKTYNGELPSYLTMGKGYEIEHIDSEGGRATYFLGQEGNISKEAWNHQQAKIDCMQVRLDGANERALSILNHKKRHG